MKIVMTHGTFDLLHYGHVKYLNRAKQLGDYLIVLVTSDKVEVKCFKVFQSSSTFLG